jgi:signal transduction histidine kinase
MAGMSIQKKLPLLVGGILLVVIVLYSWASYKTVESASLDVAHERLTTLTTQLAQLFDQEAKGDGKAMHALAADPNLRAFLESRGGAVKASTMDSVLRKTGPRPAETIRAELLDASGTPVLSYPAGPLERHEELQSEIAKAATGPDFAAVGRLRLLNDTLVIPVVAAVTDGDRPIGFMVRWRRVAATPQARDALSALVGGKAGVYIGNDQGDVWTDFVSSAPKPPAGAALKSGRITEYTRPGGTPVVATTRALTNAPWVVLVEFPRQAIMAPASAFLKRALFIGLAVLLVAMVLVWILTRSITRPLAELTGAASALAAGDHSTVVDTGRTDELGELSRAFNAMVGHVEAAQGDLEEKVRERTEELRERNDELETFGHSISHDLRAPLRAMHGFSQALLEDCGDQLDAVGKDYAERVVVGARRMDALIQDLLAYSRVSRSDMALGAVSLSDVANEALAQVEGDVAASGGTVTVAPALPAVLAHRVALVQSVANLIANGVKFMPEGRKPELRVRAEQENGRTRLWVEDNGIGIDAAHHERVFGVFERLHQSEHYPGTGIGLAIVRKSVERMGGRVGVVSATGQGSKFWIELTSARGAS